jgi:hypothetical protein
MAKRLGKLLGVGFSAGTEVGLGGVGSGLAEVVKDSWVALEIERKHSHPTENVVQYWPWLERNRRRLVLVHVIAPEARKREGHRTEITKWLGATMERVLPGRFTYCRLELGSPDEAAQLVTTADAIEALRTSRHKRKLAPGL